MLQRTLYASERIALYQLYHVRPSSGNKLYTDDQKKRRLFHLYAFGGGDVSFDLQYIYHAHSLFFTQRGEK